VSIFGLRETTGSVRAFQDCDVNSCLLQAIRSGKAR
jgi:hypothetical protein